MASNIYAIVTNGFIVSIINNYVGDGIPPCPAGSDLIDVTHQTPPATVGQAVNMRTFASVGNGIVSNVFRWHITSDPVIPGYVIVNVTSLIPIPSPGWSYSPEHGFTPPV